MCNKQHAIVTENAYSRGAAQNRCYLSKLGVTHVLNTAEGKRNGTVDTNQVSGYLVNHDIIKISSRLSTNKLE